MADSAHGVEALIVKGTVVPEPTPVWDSPQPNAPLQAPERVKPLPAVNVELPDADSELPMTMELEAGVNELTELVVVPVDEYQVEVEGLAVETPTSS
jgi:hypothetical protein